MTTYSNALNRDSAGRATSAQYGDPGDGDDQWFLPVTIPQDGSPDLAAIRAAVGLYPDGATPLTASSGNVANASAAATLAAASGQTTYITGFTVTFAGATSAANAVVTVVGVAGGTMSFVVTAPAGATAVGTPLRVAFPVPVPASATNTAIVVTCPALGSGNTHAAVVATGFRV